MPTVLEDEDEIDKIIRRNLSPSNKNPYREESFHGGMDPHTIYLYCWDFVDEYNEEQKPRAFTIEYDLAIHNKRVLIDRINDAAQDIFDGRLTPIGHRFDSFDWTRKSYIVILLTDDDWLDFAKGKAIVFDEGKGPGNHTFFGAFHPKVSVRQDGARRDLPALCFTNWMVDSYGRDLAFGQREKFHYILFPVKPGRFLMAGIDPGGNNLGPPIPPP